MSLSLDGCCVLGIDDSDCNVSKVTVKSKAVEEPLAVGRQLPDSQQFQHLVLVFLSPWQLILNQSSVESETSIKQNN